MIGIDAIQLRNDARSLESRIRSDETIEGYIDPGFVNRRLVNSLMASTGLQRDYEAAMSEIPSSYLEFQRQLSANHRSTEFTLALCRARKVPSLIQFASERPNHGDLVCSTDEFRGKRFKGGQDRAEIVWKSPVQGLPAVKLRFSVSNICSDTTRSDLQGSSIAAHVSRFVGMEGDVLVFEPLILGGPWLRAQDPDLSDELSWHALDFFELFIEDIDEFAKVKDFKGDTSGWVDHMGHVSEEVMKTFIADLLGDQSGKDWGGEFSDHFTRHIHIAGRRCTAAFLLKGPGSKHQQMTFRHLGKNGDQIFRLSKLPADLFVLQHCHEIAPAVLETLRNYIVQPHRQRRYLVIDGRDSYQLLLAYGKLDWALEETKKEKAARKISRATSKN